MTRVLLPAATVLLLTAPLAPAQVLDPQKLLDAETFWDNRDWDWYKANVPFFECPDRDIQTTYYYRWEVVTKHLTYGSPNTGYTFTEFIDRPFWSGAYGAISCPAGHQLYEVRWLNDPRYARDWFRTGLTELEAWGDATLPVAPAAPPAGNLALNPGDKSFPKAAASFTSRFDKVERSNDGTVNFHPSPANRWTSYESPNPTDWLEVDFGERKTFARVELAVYDDGGGVRAPESYAVQYWDGSRWRDAGGQKRTPERPAGGQYNEVRFEPVTAAKVRVVFTHAGKARSGVTEVFVWPE